MEKTAMCVLINLLFSVLVSEFFNNMVVFKVGVLNMDRAGDSGRGVNASFLPDVGGYGCCVLFGGGGGGRVAPWSPHCCVPLASPSSGRWAPGADRGRKTHQDSLCLRPSGLHHPGLHHAVFPVCPLGPGLLFPPLLHRAVGRGLLHHQRYQASLRRVLEDHGRPLPQLLVHGDEICTGCAVAAGVCRLRPACLFLQQGCPPPHYQRPD